MIITTKQLRIDTRIRVTSFLTIVILSIVLYQGCEKSDSGQDVKSGAQGDGSTPKVGWFDITLKAAEASTDTEAFTSVLDNVPGIGPKRKRALLRRFGKIQGIRDASTEELAATQGMNKSLVKKLKEYL